MRDGIAFKILLTTEWAILESEGEFLGAPSDLVSGFIHMSSAAQVRRTVAKHFSDVDELYIAVIDLAALGDLVKWEPSSGGQLYPHLYGPLTREAVLSCSRVERGEDGSLCLPIAA